MKTGLLCLPNSLRWRLLAGLLLAIGVFWGAWIMRQVVVMNDQQSGIWDASLRASGHQVVLSMPRGMLDMRDSGHLRLPPALTNDNALHKPTVNYQIWRRDGSLLLRALEAPSVPWMPLRWDLDEQFAEVDLAGEHWRVYAVRDAESLVMAQVALSQRSMAEASAARLRASVAVALSLVLLLGGVVWWVVHTSLRPVAALGRKLAARGPLDVQALPADHLPQEIRPLVAGVNDLLARLEGAWQAERRFLADAAHELRTPLAALMTQAQLAQSASSLADSQAALVPLIAGIERSARLTSQLLDQARVDAGGTSACTAQPVALHELTAMLVHDQAAAAQAQRQRLSLHAEPCHVRADIDSLGVLLRNLLDNACRHSGPAARIEVICQPAEHEGRHCALLQVRDNGRGVPAAQIARLTDPFYRVPGTVGQGSGLGLSLVRRIAELHGAAIEIGPGPQDCGLVVSVWLQAVAAPTA